MIESRLNFRSWTRGIGIAEEKQDLIFESFTQADGSVTRKYGGTGLGTTISRRLVENFDGEMGLESEEGKGSNFWFTAVFYRQKEPEKISSANEFDIAGMKLLIVDDNKKECLKLTKFFESCSCRPVAVAEAGEALVKLEKAASSDDPFRMVITDFQMPVMNGFELADRIKSDEKLKKTPVIVLTSIPKRGDGMVCKDLGIEGYLCKPVIYEDLYPMIKEVINRTGKSERGQEYHLITRHNISKDRKRNLRILLAEDYPTNRKVAAMYLNKKGYEIDMADNGKRAVDLFKKNRYDIILMDIQMPVMGGFEATEIIRNQEGDMQYGRVNSFESEDAIAGRNHGRIPIIAMTAHAMKGYREKCLEAGMDDYISKPLRRKELLAKVKQWVPGDVYADDHSDQLITEKDKRVGNYDSGIQKVSGKESDTPQDSDESGDVLPIDFEFMMNEFSGDKDFLLEMLSDFIKDVKGQIQRIKQAIPAGDRRYRQKGGACNKGWSRKCAREPFIRDRM